jgi:hypothetical protein
MKDAKGNDIIVTDASRRRWMPEMPPEDLDDLLRASLVAEDAAASSQERRIYRLTADGIARAAI